MKIGKSSGFNDQDISEIESKLNEIKKRLQGVAYLQKAG